MCPTFCFHLGWERALYAPTPVSKRMILCPTIHCFVVLVYVWVVRFQLKVGEVTCITQTLLDLLLFPCAIYHSWDPTCPALFLFISQFMFLSLTLTLKSQYRTILFGSTMCLPKVWFHVGSHMKPIVKRDGSPYAKRLFRLCLLLKKVDISITLGWTW